MSGAPRCTLELGKYRKCSQPPSMPTPLDEIKLNIKSANRFELTSTENPDSMQSHAVDEVLDDLPELHSKPRRTDTRLNLLKQLDEVCHIADLATAQIVLMNKNENFDRKIVYEGAKKR
jgi:hypothetical protein